MRRKWWVFLVPLYPFIWVWVISFFLSLFISEPLQWDHEFTQDQSYVVVQVLPFNTWPVKKPLGLFSGAAVTRNLKGVLETSRLWQLWLVPVHFQLARHLAEPLKAPSSAFLHTIRPSE
jgi:hypothetical protein